MDTEEAFVKGSSKKLWTNGKLYYTFTDTEKHAGDIKFDKVLLFESD